jgi:hypothetical protein
VGDPIAKETVAVFIEDLKAIFFGNSRLVAPFYMDMIKQLEMDMSFVKPTQFDRLTLDAKLRAGQGEPETVKRVRQLADEKRQGIFRCAICNEILDIESPSIIWDTTFEAYRHIVDCERGQGVNGNPDSNITAA